MIVVGKKHSLSIKQTAHANFLCNGLFQQEAWSSKRILPAQFESLAFFLPRTANKQDLDPC